MAKKTYGTKSKPPSAKPEVGRQETREDGKGDGGMIRQQQLLLNIFKTALADVLGSPRFQTVLQEVKQALFNRDFDGAFGSEEYLSTYAARWSPTRALCYASVLGRIRPHLEEMCRTPVTSDGSRAGPQNLRVVSIGGGAAETAALGAFLGLSSDTVAGGVALALVDSAPWGALVRKLHAGLTTAPELSRYASEAARAANGALVAPAHLAVTFSQLDVLRPDAVPVLSALLGGSAPLLVTLLFTLNELFTSGGIGRTTAFLLGLSSAVPSGSLLLVVDSPGSYSETSVGRQAQKYPMHWLLDKVLSSVEGCGWTRLESHDSVWFRLSEKLDYAIPLEDMRYQMHMYRVVKPASAE